MSVTLTSNLKAIMFARNPMVVAVRSLNMGVPYAAKGMSAKLEAGSSDQFADGETITVSYTEPDGTSESVVFTASPTYTAENEIPDSTFSGTSTQYWEAIRAKVQAHHRIAPYFTVSKQGPFGGWRLTVQSISSDPDWIVSIDNSEGYTNGSTAATSDTTPDNYRVLMEVYFEKNYLAGDYVLAAQIEGYPDQNGYSYYDISSILEAQCRAYRSEPFVPTFGTSTPEVSDNLRRYYVRITEEYGAPPEAQEWQYDDLRYVVDGGISQELYGEYYTSLSVGWFAEVDVNTSFLTWMPDGKEISLDQPEWLAWYNYTGGDKSTVLQIVRYDVDTGAAATPEYVDFGGAPTAKNYETMLFPICPDILSGDWSIVFADTDYKFTVRVVDAESDYAGGSPEYLSPARTYYLDRTYYESKRWIQYRSGFGCPEVWRCTGDLDTRLRVDRQIAVRPLQPQYSTFATDQYQYARVFNQEFVYRTGYLRRSDAAVLQEMLITGEVYDVSSAGYIPLQLLSETFDVTSSRRDLHSYQFNARPRLDMRNYSKKKLMALVSGSWEEPDGALWFDAFLISWDLP